MPLAPGDSPRIISTNISEMVHSGHNQAVAAALDNARRHPRVDGGRLAASAYRLARQVAKAHQDHYKQREELEQRAPGGAIEIPYFERGEIRNLQSNNAHPGGLISGGGAGGRNDTIPISVRPGAYILPADVVAGLGQNDTMSGAGVIDRMLHTSPFGIQAPHIGGRGGTGVPHPPAPFKEQSIQSVYPPHFAQGGEAAVEEPIKIVAADGEYHLRPEDVMHLGGPDLKRAHAALDEFVKVVRKKNIDKLKKLPGPVR